MNLEISRNTHFQLNTAGEGQLNCSTCGSGLITGVVLAACFHNPLSCPKLYRLSSNVELLCCVRPPMVLDPLLWERHFVCCLRRDNWSENRTSATTADSGTAHLKPLLQSEHRCALDRQQTQRNQQTETKRGRGEDEDEDGGRHHWSWLVCKWEGEMLEAATEKQKKISQKLQPGLGRRRGPTLNQKSEPDVEKSREQRVSLNRCGHISAGALGLLEKRGGGV